MATDYMSFVSQGSQLLRGRWERHARIARFNEYLGETASRHLESLLTEETRAEGGVFFSGASLSTYLAGRISHLIKIGATVGDPACGAGDLLLGCMRYAPLKSTLPQTIEAWTNQVFGTDIKAEFAEVARLRILLLAAKRHFDRNDSIRPDAPCLLSNIEQGDYFKNSEKFSRLNVIVANPPYGNTMADATCTWGNGNVQRAGVFLSSLIAGAEPGQHLISILPDVLRSGTRYEAWRKMVRNECNVRDIKLFGRFDRDVGVDVFVLHLTKKVTGAKDQSRWRWNNVETTSRKIGDDFDVSIGPVVPHRHKNVGQWTPYLTVPDATPNSEIWVEKNRRFSGTLHAPPFVVIRRTSSPRDKNRINATIVRGNTPVAVENHLIIVKPRDGRLRTCRKLLLELSLGAVNAWVNRAIRCRHLTKAVVENIPLGAGV